MRNGSVSPFESSTWLVVRTLSMRPALTSDVDVAVERFFAIDRAERLDREVPHQRSDGAVAVEIAAERGGVARRRDDVTAGEDQAVGMNDEAAPGSSRARLHHRVFPGHATGAQFVTVGEQHGFDAGDGLCRVAKVGGGERVDAHHARLHRVGNELLRVVDAASVAAACRGHE